MLLQTKGYLVCIILIIVLLSIFSLLHILITPDCKATFIFFFIKLLLRAWWRLNILRLILRVNLSNVRRNSVEIWRRMQWWIDYLLRDRISLISWLHIINSLFYWVLRRFKIIRNFLWKWLYYLRPFIHELRICWAWKHRWRYCLWGN